MIPIRRSIWQKENNERRTEKKRNRGQVLKKTQRIREGAIENAPKIAQPTLRRKMKVQIYESIQETSNDERCSIEYLCQLAGISRTSYYKWIHRKSSRVDIEDAEILPRIQAIADENNSLFGYQNMTYALNNNSDTKYNRWQSMA